MLGSPKPSWASSANRSQTALDDSPYSLHHSVVNNTANTSTKSSPGQTVFSLLHAAHALEDKLEEALGAVGLSTAKFSVLSELVKSGEPVSLSDLASRLSCVRSNMTQLVDRLESEGLVRRVADPKDRRGVRAEITDAGRVKQQAGSVQVEEVETHLEESVAESDRIALGRMLSAIR